VTVFSIVWTADNAKKQIKKADWNACPYPEEEVIDEAKIFLMSCNDAFFWLRLCYFRGVQMYL